MKIINWFAKYAWVVFVVIGAMGFIFSVPVLVNPEAGAGVFENLDGVSVPTAIEASPEAVSYVEFLYRFAFGQMFGLDFMTILIAVFAFRRNARWAWAAFCYWPILFFTNALAYEESARYVQIFMLIMTAGALAVTYRQVWFRKQLAEGKPAV